MDNRAKIQTFTDLRTWQEAHKLVIMIYGATKQFPKEEIFGLVSQMRRAVISTTSNIAEGFGRQHPNEKVQFYFMAQGSTTELQNQILAARDIGYLSDEQCKKLFEQALLVHKMTTGLIKSVRANRPSSAPDGK